jgi:hypothetical protein
MKSLRERNEEKVKEKTLTKKQAVERSIKKWRLIVAGKGVDEGASNCPLCHKYGGFHYCGGCPVEKTPGDACSDSPYRTWYEHQRWEHSNTDSHKVHCPTCLRLAEAELAFLISLRGK